MSDILTLDHVYEYNALMGVETLHPLVSVIDFSKCGPMRHTLHNFGFYTVFLKQVHCGDMRYGRRHYDYREGTLVCVAPRQVYGVEDDGTLFQPKGFALCFHPDLFRVTPLASRMREYTFFSYEVNEALHLSESERAMGIDCLGRIDAELHHAVDNHTKRLLCASIELLLDYCVRFYERQFITRSDANGDVLLRFERLLDEYFRSDLPQTEGIPTVRRFAEKVCLSPNYFGDLVKKETGRTAQEHIRIRLIDIAKERILDRSRSVAEVAYELGFKYPQHFSRLFKKTTGCTPNEYRALN